MLYKTYEIKVDGKSLICDERIILGNKFDNIITKLHFNYDETLDKVDGNKYVALYNTDITDMNFIILPMLKDDSILVGGNITKYPGKWQILLLVSEAKNLKEVTSDNAIYVSDILKCIVKDNFLIELDGGDDPIDPNIKEWYLEALKLKAQLDQYNKVIEKQYENAVKDGYSGTKEEWFTDHFETSSGSGSIMTEF